MRVSTLGISSTKKMQVNILDAQAISNSDTERDQFLRIHTFRMKLKIEKKSLDSNFLKGLRYLRDCKLPMKKHLSNSSFLWMDEKENDGRGHCTSSLSWGNKHGKVEIWLNLYFLCNRVLLNLIEVFAKVYLHIDTLYNCLYFDIYAIYLYH